MSVTKWGLVAAGLAVSAAVTALAASAGSNYGAWSAAVRVEDSGADPAFNTGALDGCPFISRDGKTFYMASNRSEAGAQGGLDIWVSTREKVGDSWGAPVNLGPPINSPYNDFCPTISRDGHLFFFVSNRPGSCGAAQNDDLYMSRVRPGGWDAPEHLACDADGGPNSAGNEAGPFPLQERGDGPVLYFSSTRSGGGDIYRSESHGGLFGAADAVTGLNTASVEGQPNLRRDGLEIFFFSNRGGNNDIYSAARDSVMDAWSAPQNLGSNVNSTASETRPSLSWDGTTLYFGSNRAGGDGDSDHYVTTREYVRGAS